MTPDCCFHWGWYSSRHCLTGAKASHRRSTPMTLQHKTKGNEIMFFNYYYYPLVFAVSSTCTFVRVGPEFRHINVFDVCCSWDSLPLNNRLIIIIMYSLFHSILRSTAVSMKKTIWDLWSVALLVIRQISDQIVRRFWEVLTDVNTKSL